MRGERPAHRKHADRLRGDAEHGERPREKLHQPGRVDELDVAIEKHPARDQVSRRGHFRPGCDSKLPGDRELDEERSQREEEGVAGDSLRERPRIPDRGVLRLFDLKTSEGSENCFPSVFRTSTRA